MLMAKEWIPFLNTPLATRLWQATVAILAGTCGNIILIYFLGSLMAVETMTHLLDWIVGFNTALTGYMLVERGGTELRRWRWVCALAGLVNALATILVVNKLYVLMTNFVLIEWVDGGMLLAIGAVCAALGGLLAKKYLKLKNNINP